MSQYSNIHILKVQQLKILVAYFMLETFLFLIRLGVLHAPPHILTQLEGICKKLNNFLITFFMASVRLQPHGPTMVPGVLSKPNPTST